MSGFSLPHHTPVLYHSGAPHFRPLAPYAIPLFPSRWQHTPRQTHTHTSPVVGTTSFAASHLVPYTTQRSRSLAPCTIPDSRSIAPYTMPQDQSTHDIMYHFSPPCHYAHLSFPHLPHYPPGVTLWRHIHCNARTHSATYHHTVPGLMHYHNVNFTRVFFQLLR